VKRWYAGVHKATAFAGVFRPVSAALTMTQQPAAAIVQATALQALG
jgi:hypothetical protein